MAEIPIQKRQGGRPMWPWLVGLLVLLVLVWALRARHGRTMAVRHDTTTNMSGGSVDTAMRAPYDTTGMATPATPR